MNPSWHWVRVGYYLDRTSVYHWADMQRQTTIHAHKHTCGDSESSINLHVFRLEHLKETQAETERTCKLHTDKPGSNSEPSCCETTVLHILYCNILQLVFPVKKWDLRTNISQKEGRRKTFWVPDDLGSTKATQHNTTEDKGRQTECCLIQSHLM